MKTIKKAQLGSLIKKGAKAATKAAPKKVTLSTYPTQESRDIARSILNTKPKKSSNLKPVETLKKEYNKKGLNMAIERRVNPEAAKKKMTKAQRQSFEVDDSYRKNGGPVKKAQNGTSEYSDPTPLFNKIKKSKDSIDNARKTLKEKMKKEEKNYKSKVSKLKMKNGGSLGMKSVKAGFDKNPGVTRADIIVAAKKEAKKGATVKKAKSGTSMKKCRYGCK